MTDSKKPTSNTTNKGSSPEQPPAAGERRAIGGYQAQYRIAAGLILPKLRDGSLLWIKVADPEAGRLDDLQLAETGRVDAFQVKWSRFPGSFTFRQLTVAEADAPSLIAQLADGWKRLRVVNPGLRVVVHLLTNDQPSGNDNLPGRTTGGSAHFAAFVVECWLPQSTKGGKTIPIPEKWQDAWAALIAASELSASDFEQFVDDCHLDFGAVRAETPRELAGHALSPATARETIAWREDMDALNLALIKLVADPRQIVQISRERLLDELRWRERAEFRNRHDFPEPNIPYRAIQETVDELDEAVKHHSGGYLLLLGSPGSGKSTLLTQTTRYRADRVVRYYAYIPDSLEPNAQRGESVNFLHDLSLALDRLGFPVGGSLPRADLNLLVPRFCEQLRRLHEDFKRSGRRTILVVDGLDHIAREQSPQRALLKDLPAPSSVPEGVYIVLGSQTDELRELPPTVRTQLRESSRRIAMRRLSRAAVIAAASEAALTPQPSDKELDRIAELSGGHPLALAYIINRLRGSGETPLSEALAAIEPFNERIDEQYETHWLAIEENRPLVHLLALLARMRGVIDLAWIERWADRDALYQLRRFEHYFRREPDGRWYFFHNSFRAFLLEKTRILPGVSSSQGDASLYQELAEYCAALPEDSPWRWDELHYRAHAQDDDAVLRLAMPDGFRAQFLAGRPIDAVDADLQLAIQAAARRHDLIALSRNILTATEYQYRAFNLKDEPLVKLLVALDRPRLAAQHMRDGNRLRVAPLVALKGCRALARAGLADEAERTFALAEPLEVLSGREVPGEHDVREANALLEAWIEVAPRFRSVEQLLGIIGRLRRDANRGWQQSAEDATRQLHSLLRHRLASSLRRLGRWQEFASVIGLWNPADAADWGWWFWSHDHGWRDANHAGDTVRARLFLDAMEAASADRTLDPEERVALAEAILRVRGDVTAPRVLLEGLAQPALVSTRTTTNDKGFDAFDHRFRLNRLLGALGDDSSLSEVVPDAASSEDQGVVFFERLVALVGRLWGRAWAGTPTSVPSFLQDARPVLSFFSRASDRAWRTSWHLVHRGRAELYRLLVCVAGLHGAEFVEALREAFVAEWSAPAHSPYWPMDIVRSTVLALLEAGASRTWVVEILEVLEEKGPSSSDLHSRLEDLEEQVRAYVAVGHKVAADRTFVALLKTSLAVGHKDDQLWSWISWAERASLIDPEGGAKRFAWVASFLPSVRDCDEVLPDASEQLLRAVCRWRPSAGVALLLWYLDHGVVTFTSGLKTLLEEFAQLDEELADIVAGVYQHVLLPLDVGGSKGLVRALGLVFAARAQRAGSVDHSRNAIRTLWESIEVRGLPSTRRTLWRALTSALTGVAVDGLNLAEPTRAPRSREDADDTRERKQSEERQLEAFGAPPPTTEELLEQASTVKGALGLLSRARSSTFVRWTDLLGGLIARSDLDEVRALANAFGAIPRDFGAGWEVDLVLSRRLHALGATDEAWAMAQRILHRDSGWGWQRRYDGGSRVQAVETLGVMDRSRAQASGLDALASDLRLRNVKPGNIAIELHRILPVLTDSVPDLAVWEEVQIYLNALFEGVDPTPAPDLTALNDSSPTEALLRFAARYLDHPTYLLATGAQRLFVDLLCLENSNAQQAVVALLRDQQGPHGVLLTVIEAVSQIKPEAVFPFWTALAALRASPHQGVRAVARRLLESRPASAAPAEGGPSGGGIPDAERAEVPLPAIYEFAFRPRGKVHRLREVVSENPLAFSTDAAEIVDVFRGELDVIAEAAEVQPEALYERVIQIVRERDRDSLEDAEVRLRSALDSINLHLTFRRPRPRAVRNAMFHAFAELVDAGRMPDDARIAFEHVLWPYDPSFLRHRPQSRPVIVAPIAERMTDAYARSGWTERVEVDPSALLRQSEPCAGLVLAEETRLRWLPWEVPEETRRGVCVSGWPDERTIQFAPDPLAALCETWPHALLDEYAGHDTKSNSLIVLQLGDRFETQGQRWLAFNPTIAQGLGWSLDDDGLFRWVNTSGEVMVESIWWEDGFVFQRPPHSEDEVGCGWLVVASPQGSAAIEASIGRLTACVRVKRRMNDQPERTATRQTLLF